MKYAAGRVCEKVCDASIKVLHLDSACSHTIALLAELCTRRCDLACVITALSDSIEEPNKLLCSLARPSASIALHIGS
jgi:hypothetical protein